MQVHRRAVPLRVRLPLRPRDPRRRHDGVRALAPSSVTRFRQSGAHLSQTEETGNCCMVSLTRAPRPAVALKAASVKALDARLDGVRAAVRERSACSEFNTHAQLATHACAARLRAF